MKRFVTELKDNEIFVFGSNTSGRHGKGAALTAKRRFGAKNGIGEGLQGRSYGIPTLNDRFQKVSFQALRRSIDRFVMFAQDNPTYTFLVTDIGTGLAGFDIESIAALFLDCNIPANVTFVGDLADLI